MYVQFTYSTLLQSCRIKKNIDAYGTMIFFWFLEFIAT